MFMTREQRRRQGCHDPPKKPSRDALLAVTRAWAGGLSGFLRFGDSRVPLSHGEPSEAEHLQAIVFALYAEDTPTFTPASLPGGPTPPRLARELWTAAERLSERAALKGRARHRIVAGPIFDRLNAFPIRALTARFLASVRKEKVRLGDTVRMEKAVRMGVLDDLVALELLGAIELRAPATRSADGRKSTPAAPRVQVDVGTERRLQREWSVLESADDYTVLGCTPGMDLDTIEAATQRMAARYRQLTTDRRVSERGHALARKILLRVLEASAAIKSGTGSRSAGKALNPYTAFEEGLRQAEAGAWDNALKCFAVAQKEQPQSARVQAWLGFALYHDYTRDLSRQRKGLAMIEKAMDLGTGNGDPGYLMAKILVAEGELVRAWNHLDRVLTRHPAHKEAQALRDEVQRNIRRT